jgi:protein TonB
MNKIQCLSIPSLVCLLFFSCHIGDIHGQSGLQLPEETPTVKSAEVMPVLLSCGEVEDPIEQQRCTNEGIMNHIIQNLAYPEEAKMKGLEGTVMVRFVINVEGKVEQVEIVRSLGPLDITASKVVASLPGFTPGTVKGKLVNVEYVLPIRFVLPE